MLIDAYPQDYVDSLEDFYARSYPITMYKVERCTAWIPPFYTVHIM